MTPGANNRAVFVGGQPCHVLTWANNQILCDLPLSGPGSSGEVIVTVRQQYSNTAYLTEWEGDFIHTVTGKGSLKQAATYHIRLQADIRLVRNHIHEAPNLIARSGCRGDGRFGLLLRVRWVIRRNISGNSTSGMYREVVRRRIITKAAIPGGRQRYPGDRSCEQHQTDIAA